MRALLFSLITILSLAFAGPPLGEQHDDPPTTPAEVVFHLLGNGRIIAETEEQITVMLPYTVRWTDIHNVLVKHEQPVFAPDASFDLRVERRGGGEALFHVKNGVIEHRTTNRPAPTRGGSSAPTGFSCASTATSRRSAIMCRDNGRPVAGTVCWMDMDNRMHCNSRRY